MMGGTVETDSAGGPARHVPVMLNEVLSVLDPASGQFLIDGTFGAGGYTTALLNAGATVLAIDRDPDAVRGGAHLVEAYGGRLILHEGEFSNMDAIAAGHDVSQVDGVVLDIGVSSMQLDQAERGFSFRGDGPLDMRMSQSGVSAADVVNQVAQKDLTRIIGILGEEKKASRVSGAIIRARDKNPILNTRELAKIIEQALGGRKGERIHPATRTFQALRIFVNRELEQLGLALMAAERILKAGGTLAVVTFHSLEDRIVKLFFKDRAEAPSGSRYMPQVAGEALTFSVEGRGMRKASETEAQANPRARSAKLRWGQRTEAPARDADLSIFGLPQLASLEYLSGV